MSQVHQQLQAALATFVDPLIGRDLLSAGVLRRTEIAGKRALIELELGFPAQHYEHTLRDALAAHLRQAVGLEPQITVRWKVTAHAVQSKLQPLAQIRNIIAIASGKGGVGKSTVAVNFALALQAAGARVGLLDADIYGPSQPRMLGSSARPTSPDGKIMNPVVAHGLQALGVGTGDTVVVLAPNCLEFVELYFAALEIGVYIAPANWHLTGPEVAYILDNSEAKAFFAAERFADVAVAARTESGSAPVACSSAASGNSSRRVA